MAECTSNCSTCGKECEERRAESMLASLHEKAKVLKKTIVLPEGNEERTLKAAVQALNEGLITPGFVPQF